MQEVVLRPLGPGDVDAVVLIEEAAFPGEAWPVAVLAGELGGRWGTYLGAFAGETLVGYGGIKGDREADLMTLAVLPQWRGRGVGGALVDALIEAARERGMRAIFLEVRASNQAARALYGSRGFTDLRVVPDYYRNPVEDAVTMRRGL